MELFWVRAKKNDGGCVGDARITDKDNLEKCIKEMKWEYKVDKCYVNSAVMCYNGAFGNGAYIGEY